MCYVLFSCDVQGLRHFDGSVQMLDHCFVICVCFVNMAVKSDTGKSVSGRDFNISEPGFSWTSPDRLMHRNRVGECCLV